MIILIMTKLIHCLFWINIFSVIMTNIKIHYIFIITRQRYYTVYFLHHLHPHHDKDATLYIFIIIFFVVITIIIAVHVPIQHVPI